MVESKWLNKKYSRDDMKSFADWCRNGLLNTEYSVDRLDIHLIDWEQSQKQKTMKINIEARKTSYIDEEFEGDNISEVLESFHKEYPEFKIISIDDKEVIGFDEGTGDPIFEGDDYKSDENGIMVLSKNL